MKIKHLFCFVLAASLCACRPSPKSPYQIPVSEADEPMMKGEFQPTWESLQNYQVPEWFRNVKFGIFSHFGPQNVEGSGDWMARGLYIEGSNEYNYHVEHYGHPSEVGFKDILPLFKAERWNPDSLLAFYKKIGAQYIVALGNHHDNFDLWDSKYQPWNSVNIGPKRDLLDGWAKAARKLGMYFGVSLHADHAWTWYETSQRHDTIGPKKGVPYDGKMTKADGKGKWWEGYDPQDLYAQNHPLSKDSWDNGAIHRQWAWGGGACPPSQEFVTNFYNRTLDVINRDQPEMIYLYVTVLPFYPLSDAGLKIAAHYYNSNMACHDGKLEGVITTKILDEEQRKALVWDVERGAPNEMLEQPWQTCTCLGGWHYNRSIYEGNGYKQAATVVKLLMDVVSKNGNLLLNVPLRADGTFDEKEEKILNELGEWMAINKEAVYDTRPWKVFGEGPIAEADIQINAQGFNEGSYTGATAQDIRFTQKGENLYVTALAWPADRKLVVKSLAEGSELYPDEVNTVELLGYGKVDFRRTADGLVVTLPQKQLNGIAPVLCIR